VHDAPTRLHGQAQRRLDRDRLELVHVDFFAVGAELGRLPLVHDALHDPLAVEALERVALELEGVRGQELA